MTKENFLKVAIIAFFIWHTVSVGIYAIPKNPEIAFAEFLREEWRPKVRPYTQITSQWQAWSMFAPDPLRRVEFVEIETLEDGKWNIHDTVSFESLPRHRRAIELKLLRRILDSEKKLPIREQYVRQYCDDVDPGTSMRMAIQKFIIPKHDHLQSPLWWSAWEPNWERRIDATITCPS